MPLSRLCDEAQLDLPRLISAREATPERLARRSELLRRANLPRDVAVVFVGSWGRHEVTGGSDNDFYLLTRAKADAVAPDVAGAVRGALREEEAEYLQRSNAELREPGPEGTFGDVVAMQSLVENIGLNDDTNDNLTQRMLLVLESVAAHNPELHAEAKQAVIAAYLEAPIKTRQPPRLFLNDVVRYWRTMCVDFAGKMLKRRGQGWGLRNAKLRTTRKMLFASGLLPVLRCGELQADKIEQFVLDQFALVPTDRVADAFLDCGEVDAGRRVFEAYERFLETLHKGDIRAQLSSIESRVAADKSGLFQRVARQGDDVEGGLLDLLFSDSLRDTTRKYGIF